MLISMNWISDFVDLSGIDKENLIKRFTLSTAEVEEVIYKGEDLIDVVVAKIISVENHPKSKKLHLLKVDAGDKVYSVVCGAPNVEEGMIVPFVKSGGRVGEVEIKATEVGGFMSEGMCCSEAELGLSADHNGLMVLPNDIVLGTDIRDVYDIRDIIFEVDNKSLTNRPDLWGHYGIAREFSALTGRELKAPSMLDLNEYNNFDEVSVSISSEMCLRYSAIKVENVTAKVSPVNMRIRLFYCGSRAINLLADLTNYLMLEMGQPMHAFDANKIKAIDVKTFDKEFEFKTLDGETRKVSENMLMICNENEPVAIAGVMGGLDSEIEDDTTSLVLESACFNAVSVRKTSTALSLRTDASVRYEKTLDPEMTIPAIAVFLKLLKDIDPNIKVTSKLSDVYKTKFNDIEVEFDKAYVDKYTGINIENEEILSTLNALGFDATLKGTMFEVKVPSWRATKDVTIKADIIEEITRIYGYDNFEIKPTKSLLTPVMKSKENMADYYIKDILVKTYGLHEVHSHLWCDSKKYSDLGIDMPENVKLVNSINPEATVLRKSIVPTLLGYINDNRGYSNDYGFFEIASITDGVDKNNICIERKKLAIALYSRTKTEKDLYFDLKSIINAIVVNIKHFEPSFVCAEASYNWQHPVNTANVLVAGKNIGFMNTLYPTINNKIDKKAAIVMAEIDLGIFADTQSKTISYKEPSKFPGIDIDLTFLVGNDNVYSDLMQSWQNVSELLNKVILVDEYEDEVSKSVTFRFSFVSAEKTLSKAEVQEYTDIIISNMANKGVNLKL